MARRYSKEVHEFILKHVEGTTTRDLCKALQAALSVEMTEAQMKSYKTNHKLKSGTPCGLPKGHPSETFPEEVGAFIRENVEGTSPAEMAAALHEVFGADYTDRQIRAYYKNHGLRSGLDMRFKPGHTPANKGTHPPTRGRMAETQFKKGHRPYNKLPIGTILKKSDGYMWKKIGEGARDWKQMHLIVWEEANGPVPAGSVITFKDGDRTNYYLDNLALVSIAESIELTRRGLRTQYPDLTETGILIARVNCSRFKKKRDGGAA